MLIGVISDTHGLLRPQATAALQGSDLIVHGGDIGSIDVVERLSGIAPVVAVRGNVDTDEWANAFASIETLHLQGSGIYILHNLKHLDIDPKMAGFSVVISGHSHKPHVEERDGVLYINPGSAGPRRFKLPVSIAKLQLAPSGAEAHIHELVL